MNAPKKVTVLPAKEAGATLANAVFQSPQIHFLGDIRVIELIGELIE